jgi:hypothetical protein
MSDGWTVVYEDEIEGIPLTLGCSFALEGESGKRYNYIRTVTNKNGDRWIDCYGGNSRKQASRAVSHDQIKAHTIEAKRHKTVEVPGPTIRRGRR